MPELTTRALEPGTWPDFARLVEANNGVWGGCWCMGFHPEGVGRHKTPEQNRAEKEARVCAGEAHAALVYDGDDCVGWCQFGVPDELPRIKARKAYMDGLEDLPDWRITCFYSGKGHRGQGVSATALAGALTEIARLGGGSSRATPRTSPTARCRGRSSTTGPWPCSSSRASPAPAGSARTAGSSAGTSRRSVGADGPLGAAVDGGPHGVLVLGGDDVDPDLGVAVVGQLEHLGAQAAADGVAAAQVLVDAGPHRSVYSRWSRVTPRRMNVGT